MHYETEATTTATPEWLWDVLSDVERWPDRIELYRNVQLVNNDEVFAVGTRAHVEQVGVRACTWEVTDLQPGQSFTWQSTQPGLHMTAGHRVTPDAGGARLALSFALTGPAAMPLGVLMGRRIRRYIDIEITALRAAAENHTDTTIT